MPNVLQSIRFSTLQKRWVIFAPEHRPWYQATDFLSITSQMHPGNQEFRAAGIHQ